MRKACAICGRPSDRARCPKHRGRQERRGYSDTAEYREVKAQAIELYGATCVLCGGDIDLDAQGDGKLELHHHGQPHEDGGAFTVDNVRPSHRVCNRRHGRGAAA